MRSGQEREAVLYPAKTAVALRLLTAETAGALHLLTVEMVEDLLLPMVETAGVLHLLTAEAVKCPQLPVEGTEISPAGISALLQARSQTLRSR